MTTAVTVYAREGVAYTDSRNVADVFEKPHGRLLATIDALVGGLTDFRSTPWFVEKHERNPQNGQLYRYYEMTRDGAALLVMGFTGRKALTFKVAYIERFNAMEALLKQAPSLPAAVQEVVSVSYDGWAIRSLVTADSIEHAAVDLVQVGYPAARAKGRTVKNWTQAVGPHLRRVASHHECPQLVAEGARAAVITLFKPEAVEIMWGRAKVTKDGTDRRAIVVWHRDVLMPHLTTVQQRLRATKAPSLADLQAENVVLRARLTAITAALTA